jgi:hypothetical protein
LRRFRYKEGYNIVNRDREQLGFIAQEVKDIFPKSISEREYKGCGISIGDMLSIDITQINYTLYGAVRRLMEKGEEMDKRIERMERIGGGLVGCSGVDGVDGVVSEVIEDSMSSNVVVSEVVSEVIEDTISSNVIVSEVIEDTMSSNVIVSEVTSMSSNVVIE